MTRPTTTYVITVDYGHPTWNKHFTYSAGDLVNSIAKIVRSRLPAEEMIDLIWLDVFGADWHGPLVSMMKFPAEDRVTS